MNTHRVSLVFLLSFLLAMPVCTAQPLVADGSTVLLLHADNTCAGVSGEQPVQQQGVTYANGVFGSGLRISASSRLAFSTAGIHADQGSVEFWINPDWNGSDNTTHAFFSIGSGLHFGKDGANNLEFIILLPNSEAYKAYPVGSWNAGEWHHIAVTWTVPGFMSTFIDGVKRVSHTSTDTDDLLEPLPSTCTIGNWNGGYPAHAVFDEIRISNRARTEDEIYQSFLAGAKQDPIISLALSMNTLELYETWRWEYLTVRGITSSGRRDIPMTAVHWNSLDSNIATIDANGVIMARRAGTTRVIADLNGAADTLQLIVKAPVLPTRHDPVDPYLATPASRHHFRIPVLIIRFLPTEDGANLDVTKSPSFHTKDPISLADIRVQLLRSDKRVKFALEEGSRFRGYKNPNTDPSLGYEIVDCITVYTPVPPGVVVGHDKAGNASYAADYFAIASQLNWKHYVEDLGVKEIWVWQGTLNADYPSYDTALMRPEYHRDLSESNMSSPVTGDVSNSFRRNDDLPVYSHTYIVYGYNMRRESEMAVHNHGHQIEAQCSYAARQQDGNEDMFWRNFVGNWIPPNIGAAGRCGWTHMAANTTTNYSYTDPAWVLSDIEDWTPENTGQKKLTGVDTWALQPYAWPEDLRNGIDVPQMHWYIYWFQAIPGYKNAIPYGPSNVMTNWWEFVGDWDRVMIEKMGLYTRVDGTGRVPSVPELQLEQNSPNPVTGRTDIRFAIPDRRHVTMKLYDMMGRDMLTLCDAIMEPGAHFVSFSRDTLSPGVYLYRMTAGIGARSRVLTVK